MNVQNAGEALYIACEMEKRAIRLYERALLVFPDGESQEAVYAILQDERGHLERFSQMGARTPDFHQAQLLSAQAAQTLFPGGLVEAQRKGAFASARSLYAFAAGEEERAVSRYGEFAALLSGEAAEAFSAILAEEKQHLARFRELERNT